MGRQFSAAELARLNAEYVRSDTSAIDGSLLANGSVGPGKLSFSFADVAVTGDYADLSGAPALGSAAGMDSGAFATAAQGALADTALQDGSLYATAAQGALADTALQPSDPPLAQYVVVIPLAAGASLDDGSGPVVWEITLEYDADGRLSSASVVP